MCVPAGGGGQGGGREDTAGEEGEVDAGATEAEAARG